MKVEEFKKLAKQSAANLELNGSNLLPYPPDWNSVIWFSDLQWNIVQNCTNPFSEWPEFVAGDAGNLVILEVLAQAPESALLDQFPMLSK